MLELYMLYFTKLARAAVAFNTVIFTSNPLVMNSSQNECLWLCMYGYVYMYNKPVVTLCFCALFSLVFYLSKDNKGHTWLNFSPD